MAATGDTRPTATRVADPGIRALYRLENRRQAGAHRLKLCPAVDWMRNRVFAWTLATTLLLSASASADHPASSDDCLLPYKGCEAMVFFKPDSASLPPPALKTLNDFVMECKTSPASIIYVEGHADLNGTPQESMTISRARAESVRAYLLSTGVIAKSVEIRSYGATKLLVSWRTSEPDEMVDSQNRRVDVHTQWPPPSE